MGGKGGQWQLMYGLLVILFLCSSYGVSAGNSPRPITDQEIREKKAACYEDIGNGLWGWQCKSSPTAKENCALQCLSSECYEHVYSDDPLEEGEIDYKRGREFKYCVYRLSLGDKIDDVKRSYELE